MARQLSIRQLSAQLAKKAQEELSENPSEIDEHIKSLRQWILDQKYLKARTGLYHIDNEKLNAVNSVNVVNVFFLKFQMINF